MKFLMIAFILVPVALAAQKGDSILAAERSIDRPLTVHKGQLRIAGAYQLSVITKKYDANGDAIKLRDAGIASVRHRLGFELKYGISDKIEIYAAMGRSAQTIRDQTRIVFPVNQEPVIYQTSLSEYTGWSDLTLAANLRAPFSKKFDVVLTLGGSLPTATASPDQPSHTISYDASTPEYDVFYHYNYNIGNGVPVGWVGGSFKYRAKSWAISARVDYRHGMKDGESYEWQHQLVDYQTFVYQKAPFSYRLADTFDYYTEFEYQPLPWLDVFMNISCYQTMNGWHTVGPDKVAIPDAKLYSINPGLELIVTPQLWFRQKFQVPVSGVSYDAPYIFFTSITYNFFPFER